MKSNVLKEIFVKLEKQKNELFKRLVSFVMTDTILFLSESVSAQDNIIRVNSLINADFVMNKGLNISKQNASQIPAVEKYLKAVSVRKISYIYLAATELRSVLLAILLAENKISNSEAFDCAFFEELAEQKKWGMMPESLQSQQAIKNRLDELERFMNEGSLS